MMKSDRFYRKGFKEVREGVEQEMGEQFESDVVNDLKQHDYMIERDGVKVYLAKVRYLRIKYCSMSLSLCGILYCTVLTSLHL